MKRTQRVPLDNHQKRLRNASRDYPTHVRGNCICSQTTNVDVDRVLLAGHQLKFEYQSLQVEPPELNMDHAVENMKVWLNHIEL